LGARGSDGAAGTIGSNTDGSLTGGDASDGTSNAAVAAFLFTFPNGDNQGFVLDTDGSGNIAGVEAGAAIDFTGDNTMGSPSTTPAGSIKVAGTFTNYDQYFLSSVALAPWVDATGKTIHAWVTVDVGAGTKTRFVAQLQASSEQSHLATGAITPLTAGTWSELMLDLTNQTAPFDASRLTRITVLLGTGASPDGGAFEGPVAATFHFDTITDGSGGRRPGPLDSTFEKDTLGYAISGTTPTAPGLSFDPTEGDPTAGSLKVEATFTNAEQSVDVYTAFSPPPFQGSRLHARVRFDSGNFPVYAQMYASDPLGSSVVGDRTPLSLGVWADVTFDLAAAAAQIELFLTPQTSGLGIALVADSPDGGAFPGNAGAVFHVDSITAE
jgi:hypothetical protein